MATLTLKNVSGKDAGTVEVDDDMFGVQPNVPVMHQVVTAQLAARRSGTQSTKTRAEVRGGGRKPYAQKGTGNARQGSIRGPHFSGGGVALGPKPRKYDQKTPKKMVKLALKSALSDRANEGKIIVVDSWGIDTPKTKTAKLALDALGITGTALVVVGRDDAAAALSFRNLPNVQIIGPGELNAYDVLCNEWIVFTKDVVPASVVADGADATKPAAKKTAAKKPADADDRSPTSSRHRTARAAAPPTRTAASRRVSRSRATPTRCCTTARRARTTARPSPKCGSPPRKRPKLPVSPSRPASRLPRSGHRTARAAAPPTRTAASRRVSRSRATPTRCCSTARTARITARPSPKCGSPPRRRPKPLASRSRPASHAAEEAAAEEAAADEDDTTKKGDS